MNFLGHIYLNGPDKALLLGNFMADSIKGNSYLEYPKNVQDGVLLHRFIDSYTDEHPAFRKSTSKLHADFSHYSGVLVDIFYDHFLAKNWLKFHPQPLETFAQDFYSYMQKNFDQMTPAMQYMFPYMKDNNWLMRYPTVEGIEKTLTEMGGRIGRQFQLEKSVNNLVAEYDSFHEDFNTFIVDINLAAKNKRKEIARNK